MGAQGKKWALLVGGIAAVAYCLVVLSYVASSPDLRIRTLIAEEGDHPNSVKVRDNSGMVYLGAKPEVDDRIVRVGDPEDRTWNFLDFSRQVFDLRNAPLPSGGLIHPGADPSEEPGAPWLVEYPDGRRLVAVEFLRGDAPEPLTSYVVVQPLPLSEVVLTFVWFVLQLGVLVFAAAAYWNRPFDRSSRMFFAMCVVTLVAFAGGFHWRILSGRLWLTLPFVVCGVLTPAVVLHFFVVFPRPTRVYASHRGWTLAAIYALPVISAVIGVGMITYVRSLNAGLTADSPIVDVDAVSGWLTSIRQFTYLYVLVAVAYFVVTLGVIYFSLKAVRSPMERGQMRWIWRAALVASVCVAYSLYLALFDREGLALGKARLPMFIASLSFMLAYSVGVFRYRLMLVDQISGKGFLYYLISSVTAVLFALAIGLGTLMPELLNVSLSQQQSLLLVVVFMLAVLFLLWMRDALQQGIDRQFFREKYQLDKALERVNRAVGHLADPESLAEMMLGSCRDVLDVNQAALYLKGNYPATFQLAACQNDRNIPLYLTIDEDVIATLQQNDYQQRTMTNQQQGVSAVQKLLREVNAELLHTLHSGPEIVGIVFLGRKKNSASFSAEDLTFLNALGQITNVALHSAKADRDFSRLNEEVHLQAEKIDEQRRQIALLQSELTDTQSAEMISGANADGKLLGREVMKGNSPAIRDVLQTVKKVAATDATVLIHGESGTGKELLAEILHRNSPRRSGPFVRVHCGALAPGILESELFGHVKGAFTGAHRDRAGRFAMAAGGTLFLDEIGDISPETQIKLLRVLQERCFQPVGGNEDVSVDVRLIAATHRNLEQLIARGEFREDLFYRLNVVNLTLPPLRARQDDVLELALHFLKRSSERMGKQVRFFDDAALAALSRYSWPGNVRELENVVERAVVMSEDHRVTLENLPEHVCNSLSGRQQPNRVRHSVEPDPSRRKAIPEFDDVHDSAPASVASPEVTSESGERDALLAALQESDGNKAEAARKLGMPRSTYYSKLKKHGIG